MASSRRRRSTEVVRTPVHADEREEDGHQRGARGDERRGPRHGERVGHLIVERPNARHGDVGVERPNSVPDDGLRVRGTRPDVEVQIGSVHLRQRQVDEGQRRLGDRVVLDIPSDADNAPRGLLVRELDSLADGVAGEAIRHRFIHDGHRLAGRRVSSLELAAAAHRDPQRLEVAGRDDVVACLDRRGATWQRERGGYADRRQRQVPSESGGFGLGIRDEGILKPVVESGAGRRRIALIVQLHRADHAGRPVRSRCRPSRPSRRSSTGGRRGSAGCS